VFGNWRDGPRNDGAPFLGREHRGRRDRADDRRRRHRIRQRERGTWTAANVSNAARFGRLELAQKSGHDLAVDSRDLFTVAKLQAGCTIRFGLGWSQPRLGCRAVRRHHDRFAEIDVRRSRAFGFGVFVTLRPADMPLK
jgi:hypothetical protein